MYVLIIYNIYFLISHINLFLCYLRIHLTPILIPSLLLN